MDHLNLSFKLNKKIEIYRDLITRKSLIVDTVKYGLIVISAFCFLRIGFQHTFTKSLFLIYPFLAQILIFGHQSALDVFWNYLCPEQPSLARYSSPQMEMKYICKTVLFDCFQAIYFIIFIPIYFTSSDNTVFIDYEQYEVMSWFYFLINMIYYCVYYLDKRNFEMQFNSHVLGEWTHIYDVTGKKNKHEEEEEKNVQSVEAQIVTEGSGLPKSKILDKKDVIKMNR